MPNSGTVTAGSVALASQYNNLRSDVLDASTGHTHTGAADAGAQIEGTAIKSTGATSGYVLTAGANATAVTWAAVPSAGGNYNALSTASGALIQPTVVAFGTVSGGTGDLKPFLAGASGSAVGVKAGQNNVPLNPTYSVRFYPYNSGTPFATATFSPAQSGSTIADGITGYGFDAAGTVAVWAENSGSGTVVHTTFRKMNTSGSILWSTTLLSAGSSVNGVGGESFGPMNVIAGINYAKEIAAWIGGDYRYSTVYWSGTASVWLINDTSGSAYSAPFATASGTSAASSNVYSHKVLFIPAASGSAGTVHHWFQDNTTPRGTGATDNWYSSYSVTGTSITEVLAPNQTATFAGVSVLSYPESVYWDQTQATGFANFSGTMVTFDRTGARLALNGVAGTSSLDRYWATGNENQDRHVFDPKTGWALNNEAGTCTVSKMGTVMTDTSPPLTYAFFQALNGNTQRESATLAGVGSATHYWLNHSGLGTGQVQFRSMPGYAEVSVLGTAAASVQARILALGVSSGGTAVYSISANNVKFGADANNMVIVPGTSTYKTGIVATTFSTAAATATQESYNIELA